MEDCKNFKIGALTNWRDPFARIQIVNAIIFQEIVANKIGWFKRARARLSEYNINMSEGSLQSIMSNIRHHDRTTVAASTFRGDGIIMPRPGKDSMYTELHCVERIYLGGMDKSYIGLPADQIINISDQYTNGVACERDIKMYSYMCGLKDNVRPSMKLKIKNADIFDYLKETDDRFNVFDFDLMCFVNAPFIKEVAKLVERTASDKAVINFVSCIGMKKCTEKKYMSLMPDVFISELEKLGLEEVWHRVPTGAYTDTWPMRYEHIVIER